MSIGPIDFLLCFSDVLFFYPHAQVRTLSFTEINSLFLLLFLNQTSYARSRMEAVCRSCQVVSWDLNPSGHRDEQKGSDHRLQGAYSHNLL